MSTKAIRNLAQWVKAEYDGHIEELADKALEEVEAIERAAKVFAGYAVERYPTREALNSATRTMESIAKDAP